ncbi:MAG: serine/threonine protein kinase [Myxococcales bacterium]|nr:serine/threonine protein kinase [Myxococcales bacterium]
MVQEGICPSCESPGPVGGPCAQPVCARRGYHAIPPAYLPDDVRTLDREIGQRWGDYLVVRRLGAGGVGAVYLALQFPVMMETAVKVLPAETSQVLRDRFQAEAMALARLRHPNIVRLLQFGVDRERPYMVMEFVEGGRTLHDACREGLDRDAALSILLQIADGLEAAHLGDVVHRDIKPANIMLQSLPGNAHFVRIVDFGLAKFTDDGHSTQLLAGTPVYMAPEQIARRHIGPWTDWYALGVITFELFTGRRPFRAGTPHALLLAKSDPSHDPTEMVVDLDLPEAMLQFFHRALAHDPVKRIQTAEQFRTELRAALAASAPATSSSGGVLAPTLALREPTQTSAEMAGESASLDARPPRRGPRLTGAAAGLVLAGAALGGLYAWLGQPDAEPARHAASAAEPPAGEVLTISEVVRLDAAAPVGMSVDAALVEASPDAAPPPVAPDAGRVDAAPKAARPVAPRHSARRRAPAPSSVTAPPAAPPSPRKPAALKMETW